MFIMLDKLYIKIYAIFCTMNLTLWQILFLMILKRPILVQDALLF